MCQGRFDNLHGDEDEIEGEFNAWKEAYAQEHETDWEYEDGLDD